MGYLSEIKMPDALFDTTVFVNYYHGDSGARNLIERVLNGEMTASYSSVTIFELWLGSMKPEEEAVCMGVLGRLEEAIMNRDVARHAATLLRNIPLTEQRRLIGDAFIAATAALCQEPLYTRNIRDFQRLGVSFRSY